MKFYSLAFAVLLAMTSFAQQNNNATISSRIIHESATLFTAEYALTGNVHFNQITHDCVQYQIPIISGTGFLQHIGRPALPSFTILLADYSSEIEITFTSIQSDTIRNILIYPWIGMPVDLVGAASPQFVIDDVFYQSNTNYPKNQTELVTTQKSRGQKISMIQICPMSYNPVEKTLIIHRLFKIEVMGDGVLAEKMNPIQQPELKNTLVNTAFYQSTTASRSMDEAITYLIITSSDYMEAALAIAEWREQTGYKTEILAQPSWTSPQIFQAISQRYYGNHPPEYVLLLGDHNKVPGVQYASDIGLFPTDRIYCYMDGGNDYFPDFAIGRISVTSSQQALIVANKIINYEKTPVTLPSFYNTALAAAYFQDNDEDGYADRRFAQTAEDILQYLTVSIGKNVSRAYYTKSSITPLFWNNDYYSAGEPVPNHLKKPTFPWNGNANNIRTQINSGTFFVFHRDHGYENGWGDPAFNNTNVASLNNGNRLPVVSSVNCQTGKFLVSECFSEAFLRHANGDRKSVV